MNFEQYLFPFTSMDHLLHSTQIVNRLFDYKERNFLEVTDCINKCLSLSIKVVDIEIFIDKITSYTNFYPHNFIKNFEEIENQITTFRSP